MHIDVRVAAAVAVAVAEERRDERADVLLEAVGSGRNLLSDARSSAESCSCQVRADSTEDIGTLGSSMAAGTVKLNPPPSIHSSAVSAAIVSRARRPGK